MLKELSKFRILDIQQDDFTIAFVTKWFDDSVDSLVVLSPVLNGERPMLFEYEPVPPLAFLPTSYDNPTAFWRALDLYKELNTPEYRRDMANQQLFLVVDSDTGESFAHALMKKEIEKIRICSSTTEKEFIFK